MDYDLEMLRKVLDPSIKINKLSLSYVTRLFPEYKDSPCIILYKQECTESLNNASVCNDDDQENKYDITGSPLKYSFNELDFEDSTIVVKQSWFRTEETYLPLSRTEACNALNACIESITDDFPPIFVLCDGKDKRECKLLGTIIQGEWFTTIEVCLAGTETLDAMEKSSSSILQQHLKLSHVQEHNVSISAFNTFDLFGTKDEMINWDKNAKINFEGNLSIEVDTSSLSLYPPTRASKNNLVAQVVTGSNSSPLKELWKQLLLLNQFLNIIEEYKKNICFQNILEFPHDFSSPYKEEHNTIVRNLDLLLNGDYSFRNNDINDVQEMDFANECLENDMKIEQYIQNLPLRYNLDLTDVLWELLIKNKNYFEMTKCIHTVLEDIIIKENFAQVNVTNSTRFAKVISNPNQQKNISHLLSGSLPLEYVIDMGFEKLYRDYMYILINARVDDLYNIQHKLRNVSCDEFIVDTYRKRLICMAQIHVCLEFMLLLQNNLECSTYDMRSLFLCAFNQYVSEKSPIQNWHDLHQNTIYSLNAPLPTSIINNWDKKIPTTRRISLSSQSKLSKLTTIKYYSRLPIFPVDVEFQDNSNVMDEGYYVTNAVCSSNKFK
ncbi:protein zwilch homolog [Hylaeus volcanicus]|uniref:protein zwilch homolog n=1 Tax=Hylaeus volcanicus TaxID=313075 RepID=UPI0023B87698|nr:protein zwilch homolog [Hylaeus volcanicus]